MPTTLVKSADWLVAWDGAEHVYRRGVDVAFTDDRIVFVGGSGGGSGSGGSYDGPTDTVIDGTGWMIMPGLVNVHSHPSHEPVYRGIREEHGVANMYMSGLYERSAAFDTSSLGLRHASLEIALSELLKSGVTSLCDISPIFEGWADIFTRAGIRGFLAPGFASARWKLENDHTLGFDWAADGGRSRMDAALAFIDALPADGLLSGVVSPMQIENCTDDLLRDASDAAKERGVPFTLHVSQGVMEVHEMIRRHGRTPIQHGRDIGILGPHAVLGHAIFLDRHSWINWWTREDLDILGSSGCSVAHCPTPFARYGQIMESFGAYVRAGVNMAIGTDTTPHNMLEEIRKAGTFSRIAAHDIHDVSTGMLFHAATVGGATAMGRDDLGRIAVGCKADLVAVDLTQQEMMPARDPLRSLVFHAADRAVSEVWVGGRRVVEGGRVLGLDPRGAAERLAEEQARMMASAPGRDYRGRTADELTPLSLPFG
jgi:5-methylthioadenosine/S-adenosylhomocysteine deaminase